MSEVERIPEASADQIRKLIINLILHDLLAFGFSAAVMFLAAGRLNMPVMLIFWLAYFLISLTSGIYMIRTDTPLMQERQDAIGQKNVKAWDRGILAAVSILTTALFALIGLDAGRFEWSQVPLSIRISGAVLMLLSFPLTLWASRANTFMSVQVRIQSERGHHVISNGPYAIVRHPMYAAMCMQHIGMPLMLNSWYALPVSLLLIAVLVLRVKLEENALSEELPGYADYLQKVKYRLFPGVW
jgi:protein-S-isoprenylcysteine O-methyltransferase Ste14